MIRGLLAKELRQHGYTLAFLFVMMLGALALIAGNATLRRAGGGGFSAVLILHYTYVPLACLVLGQVLIATEFRQKTQLFLEGLPLPRWRMIGVKFTLGLAVLVAAITAALFVAGWQARGTEAMTPRFATLVALKSAGWVWFMYTLCFALSFLGRYRVILGATLFIGFLMFAESGVRVAEFGPLALVDQRFAYERQIFPTGALAIAAGAGLGLAALGFALGLVRDASVAAMLAEKMSSREKVVMTLLSLIVLVVFGHVAERRKATRPVRMPGAIEVERGVVRVAVAAAVDAPSRAESAALERIAARAAEELGALAEYLGCTSFPPIFIVHRRDLAAEELTNGNLKYSQGVMLRANLVAKDFDEAALLERLVRESLLAHTSGLAGRDRNTWAFDGLVAWWPVRAEAAAAGAPDAAWLPAAALVMPRDFSPRHLRAWSSVWMVNVEQSRALAAVGLGVLAQRHGVEARQRFLSAMFGPARPQDVRGWLADVLQPPHRRLRTTTGVTVETLIAEWRAAVLAVPPP